MQQTDISKARDNILAQLRSATAGVQIIECPTVPKYSWPGNAIDNFIKNLVGFDGKVERFDSREKAVAWLAERIRKESTNNALVYSRVEEIAGNYAPENSDKLDEAFDLKYFVGEVELGVGESGSVWMSNNSIGINALSVLAENCYILLDSGKIRGSLCEAYGDIDLSEAQYGVFFTGPSATADIEAVHITGAQGPLSFTVLLY